MAGDAYVFKLSGSTGSTDPAWSSPTDRKVSALAMGAVGIDLYAGGEFTSIGGLERSRIAKLSGSTGAADATWNPSASLPVYALAVDAAGAVYAGGDFLSIGGQSRSKIAKLSGGGTGSADVAWNPSANSTVLALMATDTGVYAGGRFNIIGGNLRLGLASLDATTGIAGPPVDAQEPGTVLGIARQPGGGVIVGGRFVQAGSVFRANLLRLLPDGTLDPDWNPAANGGVSALAVDATGRVYVGGSFTHVGGQSRAYLAKLLGAGTGTADVAWIPPVSFEAPTALAVDAAGDVYAARYTAITKLSGSTGSTDPTWSSPIDGLVRALAMDAAGIDVYAGGEFMNIGGRARNRIAKLSGSTGAADATWNPSAGSTVFALGVNAAGDVIAGGWFGNIGGQARTGLAKLSGSGTGAADATWNPSPDYVVYALALDGAGDVIAGGDFNNIGGLPRKKIAKLSGSGVDADWNPSANAQVLAVAAHALEPVNAGGAFTSIGGQARGGLAALPHGGDLIFTNGFE